jgi:hypothetical protein
MKKHLESLLGIEMAIGNRQVKPFLILLGLLFFILLLLPIGLSLIYYKLKDTLYNRWKELKKNIKKHKYKGVKWV